MKTVVLSLTLCALALASTPALTAQNPTAPPPSYPAPALIPLSNPTLPPELMELVKLETDFEKAVAKGGGRVFASWFADDAVTLNNGQPPVMGRRALAERATWDPKDYQLSWYIEGAQMGPSGDTAFTWGHYDANGKDAAGKPFTLSGRYTTFWKKVEGKWKVALDESSNEPPDPNSPAPPLCVNAQPR
jgi:ketosteroid isomerase-like protein